VLLVFVGLGAGGGVAVLADLGVLWPFGGIRPIGRFGAFGRRIGAVRALGVLAVLAFDIAWLSGLWRCGVLASSSAIPVLCRCICRRFVAHRVPVLGELSSLPGPLSLLCRRFWGRNVSVSAFWRYWP
jgi:hypothetical protein